MGELKKWREENWVRIGTDGKIKGPCGTSKNKKKAEDGEGSRDATAKYTSTSSS